MSRVLRIILWSVGILAVALGATLFWVESQLRPEPLGARVQGLLAEAGIKGGITRVEASLDGRFSAEGVDLTLADGTKIAVASVKGEAGLFALARGTYALSSLEIKTLEVDLTGRRSVAPATENKSAEATKTTLPPFVLGPYAVTGRVRLADGTLVRFSVRGDVFDSNGQADFRAGLAWPGVTVGKHLTDPRGEIALKGAFRRPLGAEGTGVDALMADLATLRLELTAKDAGPAAAGSVTLVLEADANPGKPGTRLSGRLSDTAGRAAVTLKGEHLAGRTSLEAELDLDPTRFGILASQLPAVRVTGGAKGELEGVRWQADADLKAVWPDLGGLSPALPKGGRSEWRLAANAQSAAGGFAVNRLSVKGHGVSIAIPQTLTWKGGLLPENADEATVSLVAEDADLTALNPFLAPAGLIATAGRWTGEASVSFKGGQPDVRSVRTHSLRGVTLFRGGQPLMREVDAELPVASADGAVSLAPFSLSCAAGDIAKGSLMLRPGTGGAWSVVADVDLGIVELASQPNWEDLPVAKLQGIRVRANAVLDRAAGRAPVVTAASARIFREGADLLALKLRQPLPLDGTRPAGVIVEASARDLPLESLAALVPGLKLAGDLRRADVVAGFNREGLFVRTEGTPLAFAGTSVGWAGKPYAKDCDLTAGLDLLIGEKTTVLGFEKAELKSRGRLLAGGDIRLGLGEAATTLRLSGDLGALAEQPFAGPLNMVTGGRYQASAERARNGEIKVELQVGDVGLRRSEGRIAQAAVSGRYAPTADGLEAEGTLRVQASAVSSGRFTLVRKSAGDKTDWQAVVDVDGADVDDVLTLLPKADATETPEAVPTPAPDRAPFWAGHAGSLRLTIGTAKAYGIRARQVSLRAEADERSVRLTQLGGQLAEGELSGRGELSFVPGLNQGPYSLSATVGLKQFDFGAVAPAVPAMKDFAEGKADVTATLTSIAGTPGELPGRLQVETTLESKGGRLRAFGDKNSALALSASKTAETTEFLGALAILGGAIANNEDGAKVARIGAAMTAAAKLQKAVADFAYSSATIKASRLASGTIRLDAADIRNPALQLTAKGGIRVDPRLGFADWPMDFTTQLRGGGEFAESFRLLGFGAAPSPADGFTDGPGVNVTGSLNDVRSDLAEKLQAAVDRIRAGPQAAAGGAPQASPQAAPNPAPGAAPAPRKRNPLGDLLKELGR